MNHYRLNNGVEIPVLGFGTWKAADGEEAYQAVLAALKAGYRHIDTAAIYQMKRVWVGPLKTVVLRVKTCLLPPNFGILTTLMKTLKLLWKSLLKN